MSNFLKQQNLEIVKMKQIAKRKIDYEFSFQLIDFIEAQKLNINLQFEFIYILLSKLYIFHIFTMNCIVQIPKDSIICFIIGFINLFILFEHLQQDCPNGRLTPAKFVDMYKMFFPSGNAEEFCDHVFRTFDMDKNGYIDFKVSSNFNL